MNTLQLRYARITSNGLLATVKRLQLENPADNLLNAVRFDGIRASLETLQRELTGFVNDNHIELGD